MGNYSEKAKQLFDGGLCCSQSVVAAFADILGEDAEQLKADSVIYRGGKKTVCGAAMGARAVINCLNGVKDREDPARYDESTIKACTLFQQRFKEKIGSDVCREIKSNGLRSCAGCVIDAAEILEEMISKKEI